MPDAIAPLYASSNDSGQYVQNAKDANWATASDDLPL